MSEITSATSVGEVLRAYPELTDYLMELGLCGCEYGPENSLNWSLARAAKEKNLPLEPLLEDLRIRAG